MTEKRHLYFLAFTLLPLIFFLQSSERTEIVHQASLTLFRPLFSVADAATQAFRVTGESLHTFWTLYRTHDELVNRVASLEREVIEIKELKKENERLRDLLKFKSEIPGKAVPARVIAHDVTPWRKTVVLDKGSSQGIKKRMAVVNAQGLVGRVIEAAPFSSRVILLLDPESRVSVLFQESRDSGVAEGDGSSLLRVTRIDRDSTVKVGDIVTSSGLGKVYPKGMPVGMVAMVSTEKEGLELFATVRPYVNFSKLEELLCVALSPEDS